jgi:hypothetical protein
VAHALSTTAVIADELPTLEQLEADQKQHDADIKERSDELEAIAADHSRPLRLRLRAARSAQGTVRAGRPGARVGLRDHR